VLVAVPKILLHQLQANVVVVAKPNLNAIVLALGLQGKDVDVNMATIIKTGIDSYLDSIEEYAKESESTIKDLKDKITELESDLNDCKEIIENQKEKIDDLELKNSELKEKLSNYGS
jgi:peptidoglycan hydrolase CwlO-like protein